MKQIYKINKMRQNLYFLKYNSNNPNKIKKTEISFIINWEYSLYHV